MPSLSWWQRWLNRLAWWLVRRQGAATDLQDARIHPDGGPDRYEGAYPWEADGEAVEPMTIRRQVPRREPVPVLEPVQLQPGEPGYWEQF